MSVEIGKVKTRNLLDDYLKEHAREHSTAVPSTSYQAQVDQKGYYAVVRNIPKVFHSKELRYYFAEYVENGYFDCFHYRHRPEIHMSRSNEKPAPERCCCMVRFRTEKDRARFKEDYHLKFWTDAKGNELPLRCFIFYVKLDMLSNPDEELLKEGDLSSMLEFRPPAVMPHGNVGTPSDFFMEQIRLCKLPASVIRKLGLRLAKRIGKYGAVPLNYLSELSHESLESSISRQVKMPYQKVFRKIEEQTSEITNTSDISSEEKIALFREPDNDDGEDDDDDQCEEWERHEALHNDVTEQDRTKPKKYEEEMEVTWEKGGPGLVWYTDTFYWNEIEQGTDSDWKWADDWDVDYSIYYDKSVNSLDAKQAVQIREDEKLRAGEISSSVFRKKTGESLRKRRYSDCETKVLPFGGFEKHSKGIGSRLMKRYGWQPGKGLGKDESGRAEAVSAELEEAGESQLSGQRVGFGYRGERLQRTGFVKPVQRTIATIYDIQNAKNGVAQLEGLRDPIYRSKEPTVMKYR